MGKRAEFDLDGLLGRLRTRREFMQLFGRGLGYAALAGALPACGGAAPDDSDDPPIPAASREYTVLKRTSFGPHRDELASIRNLGVETYLERQLDYLNIDDGTLEADIRNLFPLIEQSAFDLLAQFPDNIFDVATQMIAATQFRQMFSRRQLYEIMVEFWSDHFNIHLVNGLGPTLKPVDDLEVVRAHALGNFRDLLYASAKSPAMLFYLDNFINQKDAPNENYARELMELHTLGVDGGYTEDDVKAVARCFTGWTLHFPGDASGVYGQYGYNDGNHDKQEKWVLGQQIIADGGENDGEQVLDILLAHPSTARFIATKLCRRFISDLPPVAAIDAVAAAFTRSSGDIKQCLRALFASSAFIETADAKFTRPSEYLPALVRALAPDTGFPADNGQFWFFAQNTLGQLPFYWPTPDGYPDLQSYWGGTGGLLNRWRLSFLSFAGIIPGVDVIQIDYPAMLGGADTIAAVVDSMTDAVLMRPLASQDRQVILDWLVAEIGIGENDLFPASDPAIPRFVAALTGAVLVSSIYFHLR